MCTSITEKESWRCFGGVWWTRSVIDSTVAALWVVFFLGCERDAMHRENCRRLNSCADVRRLHVFVLSRHCPSHRHRGTAHATEAQRAHRHAAKRPARCRGRACRRREEARRCVGDCGRAWTSLILLRWGFGVSLAGCRCWCVFLLNFASVGRFVLVFASCCSASPVSGGFCHCLSSR